jgi:uncharacterized protein
VRGQHFQPYFFRTSDGHELDLVIDRGSELWAIEAKLTASPGPSDMRRLDKVADLIGASHRFLISQAPDPMGDGQGGDPST